MHNPLGNFTDEVGEVAKDTVRDIFVEGKKQVLGKKDKKDNRKQDPVTGKPVPTKKSLTQLSQAASQLQLAKLQKVREELETQRLKVNSEPASAKALAGAAGPEIPKSKGLPKDDVLKQNLRNSESTGEFGRQVGG